MLDFESIRLTCEETSRISSGVIDEFILYFAASYNNIEHEMKQRFSAYKHITLKFQKEWVNMLKSQYIIHEVFKKDGQIKSFLNNPALKKLNLEDRSFLEYQSEHPWKFSFSIFRNNPADGFYLMEDVFSDEQFLLYSQGVKKILKDQSVSLWLNLISFNGACWQSFGPIGAYRSFGPEDIFFFATEIDDDIADEDELLANLEYNPVPYMMLLAGANFPHTYTKEDQIVHAMAEYDLDSLDTKSLTKSFKTEYNNSVYRLGLKRWDMPPHFSAAYFDENQKIILLYAMTDRGFRALANGLNKYGHDFSTDPILRVTLPMVTTASDILNKKISLNEYESLFTPDTPPENKKEIDKLNKLFQLIMPEINAGRQPDIDALAKKAGVDFETARDIVSQVMKKFKDMDRRL